AKPTSDGQQELQPRIVGQLRREQIILPRRIPTIGDVRHRHAAGTVHGKESELERVWPEHPRLVAHDTRFLYPAHTAVLSLEARCGAASERVRRISHTGPSSLSTDGQCTSTSTNVAQPGQKNSWSSA